MKRVNKLINKPLKSILSALCAIAMILSIGTSTFITAGAAPYGSDRISKAQAKEIALADAGLSGKTVLYTKQSFDYDDGVAVYDIEFRSGNTKYEYEINAVNGTIRDKDIEQGRTLKPIKIISFAEIRDWFLSLFRISRVPTISKAEAKELALKDAGLNSSNVRFTRQHLDKDDGRQVYEIDFISGNMEYEYDINAADGRILEKSVERIR